VEYKMARPYVATGRSPGFDRVLGSHGVECDIMGAWKEDPERELKRALALKPGAGKYPRVGNFLTVKIHKYKIRDQANFFFTYSSYLTFI